MKRYLFDSFAILSWLQEEEGAEVVDHFIKDAEQKNLSLLINILNLGEVYYRVAKTTYIKTADTIIEQIKSLPIEVVSLTDQLVMKASKIKAQYLIAYTDAIALATAMEYGAAIISGNPLMKTVHEPVEIVWIREF